MDKVREYSPGGSTHTSYTMAAVSGIVGVYSYMRLKSSFALLGYGVLAAMFTYGGEEIQNGRNLFGHDLSMMASAQFVGLSILGAAMTRRILFPPLVVMGMASTYYQYKKADDWREVYSDV
eukprot:TRINITY_DN2331_c0_g1_i3.p3 TRINITY_DN2331_c0_g1~~TRINITY_DN2331_c0_g1_i3.p3  ORF type:complete len:121 (-),score=11.01 TRINITY_DN2331_c0_g1_i3:664-1026(-)